MNNLEELLPWLYLKGVSTGQFAEAPTALLGPQDRRADAHAGAIAAREEKARIVAESLRGDRVFGGGLVLRAARHPAVRLPVPTAGGTAGARGSRVGGGRERRGGGTARSWDTRPGSRPSQLVTGPGSSCSLGKAMRSASRAASSPTPDRNDELILDSQGKPRK
jgi:hypothetical protein